MEKQFFVKTDDGYIVIPHNPKMKLNQLKTLIEEKRKYHRNAYYLVANGRPLYEDLPIEEFKIDVDSTVFVNIRSHWQKPIK